MSEYLFSDNTKPKLDHPDSAIRLACAVHRFRVPKMIRSVSFAQAFSTVGRADQTRKLMLTADDARARLQDALSATKLSAERVMSDSKRYQPKIHAILLSCKVQPEEARLDERLVFGWMSGIEETPTAFKSEAIMYDLVMTVVSEGLGHAVSATEKSVAGEFANAAKEYATAAGIFHFLAHDHLPKWISKGSNVDEDQLPAECHAPMSEALSTLFMANGQQMAVATVLMKPGTPNYSLLAKLCLGIAQQLEDFIATVRKYAFKQMARMDPDFFTVVRFQIGLQRALSLYFQARDFWIKLDYGIAIAILSEATVALRTNENTSDGGVGTTGLPDISKKMSLKILQDDLLDLRAHMNLVLRSWEKDNSAVFFSAVPQQVPAGRKIQEGHKMNRKTDFTLEECEPVLLKLPDNALTRSDSDLARELQERLNAGED